MSVQIAVIATFPTWYQVYLTTTGRDRRDVGPAWPTPREAVRYADVIDQPYTSPLRVSDGAPTSVPVPLPEPSLLDAPSEPRLGDTDPPRP